MCRNVVLYGCETWSLTLREEHRLREAENKAMKRVFGPKREVVTEVWKKYSMRNFIMCRLNVIRVINSRRMRLARYFARRSGMRNAEVLVGKHLRNSRLRRRSRRWDKNIKINLG
jgi:hypothetical protein